MGCSLDLIPAPQGTTGPRPGACLLLGAVQLRSRSGGSLPFTPPPADLSSSAFSRVRVRYQKRQKLQFETKLGMNSPF